MKFVVENVDKSFLWVSLLLSGSSHQILTLVTLNLHSKLNKMYGKRKTDIIHALFLIFLSQFLAQICFKTFL